MTSPPDRERLLADIDRMLGETRDEASRQDLLRLRDSLNSPQMRDMAQALESQPKRPARELVLEFHVPWFPVPLTATACVLTSAICLYAVVLAIEQPLIQISGRSLNLWLIALLFGALSVGCTALSFKRSFLVRIDTEGMRTRSAGRAWAALRTGDARWKDIRALQERPRDRVLEIRVASGETLEIPMKLVNYPVLKSHLDNMVMLYGEANPNRAV